MPMGQLTKEQRARGAVGIRDYWSNFTPEQRTAEMKRRFQVAQQRRDAGLGPVNAPKGTRRPYQKRAKPSTESPFPASSINRITIRDRMLAIEVAVAALKADLGI